MRRSAEGAFTAPGISALYGAGGGQRSRLGKRQHGLGVCLVHLLLLHMFATLGAPVFDAVVPHGPECTVQNTRGCYGADKLRIAIITVGTTHSRESARLTAFINELYTARHGYNWIVERCAASTARPYLWGDDEHYQVSWSKSLFLLRYLPHYDFVMFIDGDIFFVNHTYSVEAFVAEHMTGNATILFQSDCYDSSTGPIQGCWNRAGINTGFVLVENAPTSFAFLREWSQAPDDERCNNILHSHPRDQMCADVVARNFTNGEYKVVDSDLIRGLDGTWALHLYESRAPTWSFQKAVLSFAHIVAQHYPHMWANLTAYTPGQRAPWLDHPARTW